MEAFDEKPKAIVDYDKIAARYLCEQDHLFFTRYFFKHRNNAKFKVNWHHHYMADELDKVIEGANKNLILNVPPGSSKTEFLVNFIARALCKNQRARFLYLSYSDDLASLNSQTARDIILSDAYQELWPVRIAEDTKSKKRWNIVFDGQSQGGVYATSLGGQVTGFRAGHMEPGFQGAILIDDPLKPEDAFSRPKIVAANRKLLSTVKSRRANPETPIIVIMQRISEDDPTGFIEDGNLQGEWTHIKIPAILDDDSIKKIPKKYHDMIEKRVRTKKGRFSYWPYKEPLKDLLAMERGDGANTDGSKMSRHVFASQYQQEPVALGGNMIRGEWFRRYKELPPGVKIKWRKIFADTAQKTKEKNDFSVFAEYGLGSDGWLYLLDMIRGKWEAPELKRRAVAFWSKCNSRDTDKYGQLRKMVVEDKSSGTGLIQDIKADGNIPIEELPRDKDKLTRVMDVLSYIEARMVAIPEDADFTNDFVLECEAFSADGAHKHDDQIDPLVDAVKDMLASTNKMKVWERVGRK